VNRLPTGTFLPGISIVHRLDARVKLLALFIIITTILLINSILGYAMMVVFIALVIITSGIQFDTALNAVNRLYWFFLLIFLMNTLFYCPDQAWFSLWILTPSLTGMVYGMNVVLRVFLVLVVSNVVASTTAPMETTYALESLVSPLRYVGIPTGQIAMILSIAIQFIPTISEETETIRKAQTARGARFDSNKLTEKAAAILPLVIPIFFSAFKRADDLSVAMEARGYSGVSRRTTKRFSALQSHDYGVLVIVLLIFLLQVVIRLRTTSPPWV